MNNINEYEINQWILLIKLFFNLKYYLLSSPVIFLTDFGLLSCQDFLAVPFWKIQVSSKDKYDDFLRPSYISQEKGNGDVEFWTSPLDFCDYHLIFETNLFQKMV